LNADQPQPARFKKGDVVRHKTSRRRMQVDETGIHAMTQEPAVWCLWMDGDEEQRGRFDPGELEAET